MEFMLNPIEIRILGSLMEKEVTTPEYYPLTLNALTRACNQRSNRYPVIEFDEETVLQTLEGLTFDQNLAKRVISYDSRVPKYRHALTENLSLTPSEAAILCVLMLRGRQTAGEIRGRTERLCDFANLAAVETTLQSLMEHDCGPLVAKLPRQPGRKEARFAHLLCGELEPEDEDVPAVEASDRQIGSERIEALINEIGALRQELDALKQAFKEFKEQFE
ncbi:MAG: YceH family protein [bacterium]|nr:YceH family protein [bacterium]